MSRNSSENLKLWTQLESPQIDLKLSAYEMTVYAWYVDSNCSFLPSFLS